MQIKGKSLYMRFFVYSTEEKELRERIHGANKKVTGTVIVNGVPKEYTSIVTDISNTKSDAIVVISGDIRKIKYTPPEV